MSARENSVWVTGVGAVSCHGWGSAALWSRLSGRDASRGGVAPLTLFSTEGFRTSTGCEVPDCGADPSLSRADRFALFAAEEAAGQAHLEASQCTDAGVFFGSSTGGLYESEQLFIDLWSGRKRLRMRRLASQQNSGPGDAVARRFDVHGPVVTQSSACTSANMAIEAALRSLRSGEAELAFAGGSDGLCRITYAGFNSLRAVDPKPTRPFRKSRAGLALGEGAGVLVLETAAHARRRGARPLAELAGAGSSCDAFHMSAPKPDGLGPATAMRLAIADAELDSEDIDFVNAHGTGTTHNDPVEAKALQLVFGERVRSLAVTSTKASVGHLLGACGGLEAVVTVLALQQERVPPTPGDEPPDEELGLDVVVEDVRVLERARAALSTNLAFGGTNTAIVLKAVDG